MSQNDLLGRLSVAAELGPLALILGACLALATAALLAKRFEHALVSLLWIAVVLAASVDESIDAAVTLARWWLLMCLALSALLRAGKPSLGVGLMGAYGCVVLLSAPFAPSAGWAVQVGLLLIVTTWGAGAVLRRLLSSQRGRVRLWRTIETSGWLWTALAVAGLFEFSGGGRYSGVTTSAPLFAITGGLLSPMLLWISECHSETVAARFRVTALFVATLGFALFSGQRTGALAGIVGSLIVLARPKKWHAVRVGVVLTIAAGAVVSALSISEAQAEFLRYRVTEKEIGREDRWRAAVELCLAEPLVPHGAGAAARTGFGFHNAFLVAWYEGGGVGLLLFAGGFFSVAGGAAKKLFEKNDDSVRDRAFLVAGVLAGLLVTALAEAKFASPSNVTMIVFVTVASLPCGTPGGSSRSREATRGYQREWRDNPTGSGN